MLWRLLLLIQNRCEMHWSSERMSKHKITLESWPTKLTQNIFRHAYIHMQMNISIYMYVCIYLRAEAHL